MAGMIADIRGALGGQVASLAAYLARGPVDEIRLNVANVTPHSRVDYLSDIFTLKRPVRIVESTRKIDLTSGATLIAAADAMRSGRMPVMKVQPDVNNRTFVHVRVGDRQTSSRDAYQRMTWRLDYAELIGNDRDRGTSAVEDWLTILGARRVYSSVSFFTLTAAMMRPELHLTLMEPDGPIPMVPAGLAAIRELVDHLPNVDWIVP